MCRLSEGYFQSQLKLIFLWIYLKYLQRLIHFFLKLEHEAMSLKLNLNFDICLRQYVVQILVFGFDLQVRSRNCSDMTSYRHMGEKYVLRQPHISGKI